MSRVLDGGEGFIRGGTEERSSESGVPVRLEDVLMGEPDCGELFPDIFGKSGMPSVHSWRRECEELLLPVIASYVNGTLDKTRSLYDFLHETGAAK